MALDHLRQAILREIDVLAAAAIGNGELTETQMHMLFDRIAHQLGREVARRPGSAVRVRLIDYWWGDAVDQFNKGYEAGMRAQGMRNKGREIAP